MCRGIASLAPLAALLAGCTTIGMDTPERQRVDYGEPVTLDVCVLKNEDVKQERADVFIATLNEEFSDYGITINVPWVRPWKRPAFQVNGIMAELMRHELEPPCDRLLGLVDRNAGDFLWGLLLPEVLGAVEETTHTHGYVVANFGSLNQAFSSVEGVAIHEFYHLVGCGHGVSRSQCYHRIAALKASRPPESEFFPGVSPEGEFLVSRNAVNLALKDALAGEAESADLRPVAIRAGRLLDVRNGTLVENAVILTDGLRISAAGPADSIKIPAKTTVLDWSDLTVLPGLVDAHVHLAWGGPQADQPLPGTSEALATLEAGFTAVRNPGSTGGADMRLRDAIEAGEVQGPRMQAAGAGLGRPEGVCEQVFAGEGRATGVDQARARAIQAMDAGADLVKLCAGGGVVAAGADADSTEFSEAEIRAVVDAAHARGHAVAVHAQGPAAIGNAVRAGADSIEHGALIDEPTAQLMKAHGTYLVPTLYRLDWQLEAAEASAAPPEQIEAMRQGRDAARENIRRAIAVGVPIAFGTDATVYPHGLNARELSVLVQVGMTPAAAIRSATLDAAKLMGWDQRIGEIRPGRLADLVAVRGNPLEDVSVLEHVVKVMKGGRLVRDDPAGSSR